MAGRVLSAADLEGSEVISEAAPARGRVLSAADLEGSEVIDAPTKTSGWEALARGAKQGATFGFGDEITGALESAFTSKTYEQARDEARAADKLSQGEHPWAYGAGEIGAGVATAFVPGLGIAKGAKLAATIGKSALLGGIGGLGSSDAEDMGGIVRDTAIGAGIGGAGAALIGGAGKLLRGAPGRIAERETNSLLEGVAKGTQDKSLAQVGGRSGLRTALTEEGLAKAAKGAPQKFAETVDARLSDVGEQIGDVYAKVDKASPGVTPEKVFDALETLQAKYRKGGDIPKLNAVKSEMAGLREIWGEAAHVPAEDVHQVVRRYGRAGFSGNTVNVTDARQLGRDMNAAVREVLQDHVDEVAKANLGFKGATELRALNKRYSVLDSIADVAEARAKRAEGMQPTLAQRLAPAAKAVTDAGAIASSVATGNYLPLLLPIATRVLPKAAPLTDLAAQAAGRVLLAGGGRATAIRAAMGQGLTLAAAEEIVGSLAPPGNDSSIATP